MYHIAKVSIQLIYRDMIQNPTTYLLSHYWIMILKHLCYLTYIYILNWMSVDCFPNQRFKLYISLIYATIPENVISERVIVTLKSIQLNWSHVTKVHANLIINSIHAHKWGIVFLYSKPTNCHYIFMNAPNCLLQIALILFINKKYMACNAFLCLI